MRVLQVIGSKGGGGAESFFVRLALSLQDAGVEVLAIVPPHSDVSRALEHRLPVKTIAMRGVWDIFSYLAIRRVTRQFKPDIVQTWMGRATRLVHLPRQQIPVHLARLGGYYDIKGYRHAHAWIGNTRGICDYLVQQGIEKSRVFHLGNFAEKAAPQSSQTRAALRAKYGIPEAAVLLFAAGRLHPNKGFDILLQAFSKMPKLIEGKPVHLLIAGDGPLTAELKEQAIQAGLTQHVTWAGWQQTLGPYFSAADIFICPSRHEPLGNILLEAWAHHIPVISTSTDGAREIATHDKDALLVPCEDPSALAQGVLKLIAAGEDFRNDLVHSGLATLEAAHSRKAITKAYQKLYQELVASCVA